VAGQWYITDVRICKLVRPLSRGSCDGVEGVALRGSAVVAIDSRRSNYRVQSTRTGGGAGAQENPDVGSAQRKATQHLSTVKQTSLALSKRDIQIKSRDNTPAIMATIQPISQQAPSNYDYLRRKPSERVSLNRSDSSYSRGGGARPARTPSERVSNGTVGTVSSTYTTGGRDSLAASSTYGGGRESLGGSMMGGRESLATNMTEPPAWSKKIVVVGDGGCGKTCLLISYAEGHFPEVRIALLYPLTILLPQTLHSSFSVWERERVRVRRTYIDDIITEIRPNSLRKLHHNDHASPDGQSRRARSLGHSRTRRI
jgi:hypothetical protein